jgi:hypothetical protein
VVGRKSLTEIFASPVSERSWHGLGMSHVYQCLYGDQPQLPLTSEDWTHFTISTGLAEIAQKPDAACVQWGEWGEGWYSDVWIVTWRFVWSEVVLKITTQIQTFKTSFCSSSIQADEASTTVWGKEHVYLQVCLETYLLHYAVRNL